MDYKEQIKAKDKRIAELEAEVSGCIEFLDEGEYPDKKEPVTELERKLCEAIYNTDDTIADLQAQLAEHEWVSVEDRLPEETGWYAVRNGDEWARVYYAKPNNWVKDLAKINTITHWKTIHLPGEKVEKSDAERNE